ncbi:hypothetical protein DUNSADRAFT_16747 [Dunaliella salina]|nr:hypothetical protein DUNSADRAFT_16747 [Dunaliella salina]|eukprot:KAF5828967.1 hypothetical protein DUNSADRAFT_16747 [Dunaliella salina]
MAHFRTLQHLSVSGRVDSRGALLPCKHTMPCPPSHARLVISAMAAADDSRRPGGRARFPSSQGTPTESAAAPPQSPDVERPSNGAGRVSSSASVEEPPSTLNDVLERPSGGSSRVSMPSSGNGNPGDNGSISGGPGGNSSGGGSGPNPKQGGSSGGGGDFLKPLLTWGVLYAFLASIAWLGSK